MNTMITRRNLAKLAGLGLGATALSGCGGSLVNQGAGSADASGSSEEEITITAFSQLANWSGEQVGWGAVLLKDLFNMKVTVVPDTDGAYQTRMENGDLGDLVVWGTNGKDYQDAVEQGRLFDWEEDDVLADHGKDIESYFPEALEANREISGDGKIYGIGNNVTDEAGDHDLYIYEWSLRWDLYQQLGHPAIKSLSDLASVLKQMQELAPTSADGSSKTYACSLWPDWDGEMVMYVAAMVSAFWGYDQIGIGHYNSADGSFVDCLKEDGPYLESLRFFNGLYREGLLDPDSMTQTYDEMIAKVRAGGTLFSLFNYTGSIAFNNAEHAEAGMFMAPRVPDDAKPIVNALSLSGEDRIWSIGDLSNYPERVLELINWLFTPEGALTNYYGPKGLMWDYDADGKTCFTDLGRTCYENTATDLTGTEWTSPYTGETYELSGTYADGSLQFNNTTWANGAKNPDASGDCFNEGTWESNILDPVNDAEADWRKTVGAESNWEYFNNAGSTVVPTVNFSEETRDNELELKWQQVTKAIKDGSWRAMYADDDAQFDSLVSDMRTSCDGYGYEECVAWCQEQCANRYEIQQQTA